MNMKKICTYAGFCQHQKTVADESSEHYHIKLMKSEMMKRNITQGELAKLLGVSQAAIGRWLNGKNKITNKNKLKIQQLCEGEQGK